MTTTSLQWNLTDIIEGKTTYQLTDIETVLMNLQFDGHADTVHLHLGENRRTFKIEKQGFLRSKLMIKNEYGVKVGGWTLDKNNMKSAEVELYEQKFICELTPTFTDQFTITSTENKQSLFFRLPITERAYSGIETHQLSRISAKQFSFIVALCWHLQKSNSPEKLQVA
jgi:hypothetical protein